MSIRGTSASVLFVCFAVFLWCSAAPAAKPAPPASTGKDAPPAANGAARPSQTNPPVRIGTVQEALQRLFVIPRPSTRPAETGEAPGSSIVPRSADAGSVIRPSPLSTTGDAISSNRLGLQHRDAIDNSVSSVPIGGRTLPHRLGLQHSDAIEDSVSSVPIGGGRTDAAVAEREKALAGFTPVLIGPGIYLYPRHRLPYNRRDWTNYLYYNGQPSRYGYGMNDAFGDDYAGDIYRFGFNRGYNSGRFDKVATERQERVLTQARGHLERGLEEFHEGRYRQAADAFKLAAETNQGDPAARIYAAHALFATGRYRDAVTYLRRAFELQPRITMLNFDMRDDYGKRADFDQHLESLENALKQFPQNTDRLALLGYVRYYSNQRDKAHEPLAKAGRLDPQDRLVQRLLENCRPPDVILDREKTGDEAKDKSN